jgi:bacillithiol synthase
VTSGEKVLNLYGRAPANFEACREAAKDVLKVPRDWKALAEIFERAGREYGVPEATLSRLELLASGKAVAVVTGQQVGYLGGPFYTFLKAYHATRIAAEIERRLGIPTLPIFWLEGEDHDLEEVRDAHFLNRSGELQSLRFEPENEIAGFEVGRFAVDAAAHLDELKSALDGHSEAGLEILRSAYSGTTLSEGMGRLLASTLGARGLLVVEGMDSELKRLALFLWEKVISAGPRLTHILDQRTQWLKSDHWGAPLSPTPEAWMFYVAGEEHVRGALHYDGRLRFPDQHSETLSAEELLLRVKLHPEIISPKAPLRPLYQDYVLPTVAYVAGPGELDYHAQLTPFYAELGIPAPSLFPRLSATVTTPAILRQAEKIGFSLEQLLSGDESALRREIVRREDDGRTLKAFDEAKQDLEAAYGRLKSGLTAIDPTLVGAAHTAAGKSLHPLQDLRQKAEKALKQKHSTQVARLEKCLTALRPTGKPAERVLSTAWYLARFGPEQLLAALDELPVEARLHYVIAVSTD